MFALSCFAAYSFGRGHQQKQDQNEAVKAGHAHWVLKDQEDGTAKKEFEWIEQERNNNDRTNESSC